MRLILIFLRICLIGRQDMFIRLGLSVLTVFFLSACSAGQTIQHSNTQKNLFGRVVAKELNKTNRKFVLIQKTNNKEHTFLGNQIGNNWILKHTKKDFRIEKKGNKVFMIINKRKETLSIDQFGIISPLEHLKLVGANGTIIRNISNNRISNKISQLSVVLNEQKLVKILRERLNAPNAKDISPYLSGKVKVTYELFYTPKTNNLIRFSTTITSLGNHKESCTLTYLFQ